MTSLKPLSMLISLILNKNLILNIVLCPDNHSKQLLVISLLVSVLSSLLRTIIPSSPFQKPKLKIQGSWTGSIIFL